MARDIHFDESDKKQPEKYAHSTKIFAVRVPYMRPLSAQADAAGRQGAANSPAPARLLPFARRGYKIGGGTQRKGGGAKRNTSI